MDRTGIVKFFAAVITLFISIVGMIVYKQRLEMERSLESEIYFWIFLALFWGTVVFLLFTQIYDRWIDFKSLKNEHSKSELALLKSKVDPHFFFNTLNNLYALTVEKSEKAPEVILTLSDIMRYVIYESKESKVPLEREIEYLEKYIEISRIRFSKNVEISFEKNLSDSSDVISPMLLPVLVENAFKHGIEKLENNAYMDIQLKVLNNILRFEVVNNYPVLNDGSEKGIGLSNLRERLLRIYPEKHRLELMKKDGVFAARLTIALT